MSLILICLKKITKVSPLNNFFKIPEIVIDKIATYKSTWFNFAINFCPTKISGASLGVGLSILFISLKITKYNTVYPNIT